MVVQNVQNGLYGVWSAEKGQLTVPCRYQSVRLLTGQCEGTEAPPPEIVVAATMNGRHGHRCSPYDGKVFLPREFDEISTASGLLAVLAKEAELHITTCERERRQYRRQRRTAVR